MPDLTNLPSKLCRAIRFHLTDSGAIDPARCYHQFDARARQFNGSPIVTITLLPVVPEPVFTGDHEYRLMIVVGFNAVEQPDDEAEATRVAFDAQVGRVRAAMMQSDDGGQTLIATLKLINAAAYKFSVPPASPTATQARIAEANADLNDFTLLKLVDDTYGIVKMEELNWTVGMAFRVTACESRIEGYV